VVILNNHFAREKSPKSQVYQTYVQSSMTESWLCSDMPDACQKALQHAHDVLHASVEAHVGMVPHPG